MSILRKEITEERKVNRRLGRHLVHDSVSWRHPAPMSDQIFSVEHAVNGNLPLDQGQVGSCTGNAITGMLSTEPFSANSYTVAGKRLLDETDAVRFYHEATRLDPWRGVYPPDDTGSSGLAACKAAANAGYLTNGYGWSFGLEHAVRTLALQPGIVGTYWYSGMDSPDRDGVVRPSGSIRGGHEYLLFGLVINNAHQGNIKLILADANNYVKAMNSWGPAWGVDGTFFISLPDLGTLLKNDGDFKTGIVVP